MLLLPINKLEMEELDSTSKAVGVHLTLFSLSYYINDAPNLQVI